MCYNERNKPNYWLFIKQKYMKKVLFSFLALTLASSMLGAVVFAEEGATNAANQLIQKPLETRLALATSTDGLEKILNPSQIKYYEGIRKISGSLWGKKRINASGAVEKSRQNVEKKPETSTKNSNVLEKISNPSEIKNFEEIRKIENSLWGKRKDSSNSRKEEGMQEKKTEEKKNTENKEAVLIKPEATQCVKTAIDKKDTSLKASISAQGVLAIAAIDARNTCQKTALDKTTLRDQTQANKSCLEAYHQAVWDSLNVLKQSKETSWRVYTEDLKACAVLQRTPNTTNQEKIVIEDGEMQINLKAETEMQTEK
jgi:predicted nucleic acid-binding protein